MKKQKNKKIYLKDIIVILLCLLLAIISGICSKDVLIGSSLLATGLISSFFASIGKRVGYVFGFVNALLLAYVAYKNNLFGSFAINAFIFAPLEVYGFMSWGRNLDRNKNVKIRKFTIKNSILVTAICTAGSIMVGHLLTLIPGQQLAFLDSTISCIDICALVLMNLRFRESWWLWVLSGLLSVIMWSITLCNGGDSAFMRLLAAIGFTVINLYGAIKWGINKKAVTKKL